MSDDIEQQKNTNTDKRPEQPKTSPANKKNKTTFIVIAVVLLLGGFFVIIGLSRKAAQVTIDGAIENAINSASGTDVDINSDNNSVTIKTKDGDVATYGVDQQLSADFPSEVPLYDYQEISSSSRFESRDGIVNWIVETKVSADLDTIKNSLTEQLSGWSTVQEFLADGIYNASYTKDNISLTYVIAPSKSNAAESNVSYNVAMQL